MIESTQEMSITENVERILEELPAGVSLAAAAKTRLPAEILEAAEAGIDIIGENYVQEAEQARRVVGDRVRWHMIGHLQKNKAARAAEIFDMIETVDSVALAVEINRNCARLGRVMPVLIEVNSGRETQKTGVLPEEVEVLAGEISLMSYLRLEGLMTMGPASGDPEEARPYFTITREMFEKLEQMDLPGVRMKYLSMGMTNSYHVAIEEGADLVRLGTAIFGERRQTGGQA